MNSNYLKEILVQLFEYKKKMQLQIFTITKRKKNESISDAKTFDYFVLFPICSIWIIFILIMMAIVVVEFDRT